MPTVNVLNTQGSIVGEIELSEEIFGAEINVPAMHAYVTAYNANQRQGTQSAKTRAEVSGGGKKPWRQKGTGRARQGSTRSPQWTHGGVVFAPKPRDYRMSLNKKLKRVALKSALSSKVASDKLVVLDALELSAAKTKEMVKVLANLKLTNALIVLPENDDTVIRAARNIPGVASTTVGTLNTYEVHNSYFIAIDDVDDDTIKKLQIRKTIEEHLDKELRLRSEGIKVLSLFFIDKVANYRYYDSEGRPQKGKYAIWFEEAYKDLIKSYPAQFSVYRKGTLLLNLHQ